MKAALVALMIAALPAAAQDAQVVDGGVLLPDAKAVEVAQRIVRCEAERDSLKEQTPKIHPALLAVIVGLVAGGVGFGLGYGIAYTKK